MKAELRTFFPINSHQGNFIVLTPAFRSASKGRYRPWMLTVFDVVHQEVKVVRAVSILPDIAGHSSTTMRRTHKSLYQLWSWLRGACYRPWHGSYHCLGARGITIDPEWLGDFDKFAQWALDNQYQPGRTLVRIDENGPFAPWNCRWAGEGAGDPSWMSRD